MMGIRLDQAAALRLAESAGRTSAQSAPRRPTHTPPAAQQAPTVELAPVIQTDVQVSTRALRAAIEEINQNLQSLQTSLDIIHDDPSGRSAVVVRDSEGKVIRQLPPQAVLDAFARVRQIVGVLVDESV